MHFLCLAYNEIHLAPPAATTSTTTAALLAGVSGVRVLLMILQMRLMTLRCHLPGSQGRKRCLFGLSKYLLKWQQLNAYEMVITHTPHCAAEGSAATYCRSFILLIAPVGERHWARFIKQLDRKSSQLSWAQLTFAVLVARLNWRCRCVCHFYNKLWPIELSLSREKEERKPTVWQFLASLDGVIVAGISCVHFWRSRERESDLCWRSTAANSISGTKSA